MNNFLKACLNSSVLAACWKLSSEIAWRASKGREFYNWGASIEGLHQWWYLEKALFQCYQRVGRLLVEKLVRQVLKTMKGFYRSKPEPLNWVQKQIRSQFTALNLVI